MFSRAAPLAPPGFGVSATSAVGKGPAKKKTQRLGFRVASRPFFFGLQCRAQLSGSFRTSLVGSMVWGVVVCGASGLGV